MADELAIAEPSCRRAVLRDNKERVRASHRAIFAKFPQNRGEILKGCTLGDYAVLDERVLHSCSAATSKALSIYSFEGDKCSRVEFVR